MNMDDICNSFFNNNKTLSSTVLLSFNRSSNKSNNISSLINYIINSLEFKEFYDNIFADVYYKIIDDGIIGKEIINKYVTLIIKNKSGVNEQDIQTFIKNDDIFDKYYTKIINTFYTLYCSDKIDDVLKKEYLCFIKQIDFLNEPIGCIIDKIKSHIYITCTTIIKEPNEKNVPVISEQHKKYFINTYKNKFNTEPSIDSLEEFNQFFEDKNNIVDLYFNNKYNNCSIFYKNIIESFIKIFDRDITVFEYVKYYDCFSNDIKQITTYKETFDNKFNIVVNIYNSFLNTKITYLSFINRFLDIITLEDNSFTKNIIDIVVNYEIYKISMGTKISSIYENSYDTDISVFDLDYFFKKVYLQKLNLIDDSLNKVVNDLKEETSLFENKITEIISNILRRCTDRTEMDHYIKYFRYPENNIKPNIRLENELYESLEYHDILKSIISDRYFKDKMNKSDLFKMLKTILENSDITIKRDVDNIYKILDTV